MTFDDKLSSMNTCGGIWLIIMGVVTVGQGAEVNINSGDPRLLTGMQEYQHKHVSQSLGSPNPLIEEVTLHQRGSVPC